MMRKDYVGALSCYTDAIKVDPSNRVLYSNRSNAYTRLGNFEAALKDADDCIRQDRDWHKGFGRRGAALAGLSRDSSPHPSSVHTFPFAPRLPTPFVRTVCSHTSVHTFFHTSRPQAARRGGRRVPEGSGRVRRGRQDGAEGPPGNGGGAAPAE